LKKCIPTKWPGRLTKEASRVTERLEVLVAMIDSSLRTPSSFSRISRLSSRSSGAHSITRSQPFSSSRGTTPRMRSIASVASDSPIRPLVTSRARDASICARPRSTDACRRFWKTTS
jgi:hypothetical protein